MAKQELSELGFFGESDNAPPAMAPVSQSRQAPVQHQKQATPPMPTTAAEPAPAAQQQPQQQQQPTAQPK